MIKKLLLALFASLFLAVNPVTVIAQEEVPQEVQMEQAPIEEQEPEKFYLARVKEITDEGTKDMGGGAMQPYQNITLTILNGDEKGKEVAFEHGSLYSITEEQKVSKGDLVVLTKSFEGGEMYYIADVFRLHILAILLAIIVVVWAILGRGRNLGMIIALLGTFAVAFYYLIPNVVKSVSPYSVIVLSAALMLGILVFVGYGVSRKTLIVFSSTFLTTLVILVLSYFLFQLTGYTGTQTDRASFYLSNSIFEPASLRNMFLASVVTATLGITTYLANKQINLVEEIKDKNKKVKLAELYKKVLVNPDNSFSPLMAIIFMSYLATNLTVIWLFRVNPNLPFWVTFNSEYLFSEILGVLISMAAVVLVIPITTHFAITFLPKKS